MYRGIVIGLGLFFSLAACSAGTARAVQYEVQSGGRAMVAHTRLAPVVVHRAFPPFKGAHVYGGRSGSRAPEQGQMESYGRRYAP